MLRKLLLVASCVALFWGVACGHPTGPSSSTTPTTPTVTVVPPAGVANTPAWGQSYQITYSFPFTPKPGQNVGSCVAWVRDDGARFIDVCGSGGPNGGTGGTIGPNSPEVWWGGGHTLDAEVLAASVPLGVDLRSIFGWNADVHREKAEYILPIPLGWKF